MKRNMARLGDIATITSGFAFKSSHFNEIGDGLPLVRIRDVVAGSSGTFYSGEFKDEFLVKDDDALIGMDGEFNLAKWRGGRALLNQRVCKVQASDSRVDQEYLIRFLPSALKRIEDRTPFVTVKHLSVKELREVEVPIPPIAEQQRVAAILAKAEALRAKRRETIAKLDQLLRSVFLETFGDVSSNEIGWPEANFGDLVESTKLGLVRAASEFGDDPGLNAHYIRMDSIGRGGEFLPQRVKKTVASSRELQEASVQYGDLLFNTRNSKELVGKAAIFDLDASWTFNNNLMRVRFNERANPFYVLRYLMSPRGQMELEKRKSGTTNVFAVYYKDLKSMPVVVPPKELQDGFQRAVESQKRMRNKLVEHADHLQKLIGSIQEAAFSGCI